MVEESLFEIEETQQALRHSIEQTKELAADLDRLISLHREQSKVSPR